MTLEMCAAMVLGSLLLEAARSRKLLTVVTSLFHELMASTTPTCPGSPPQPLGLMRFAYRRVEGVAVEAPMRARIGAATKDFVLRL